MKGSSLHVKQKLERAGNLVLSEEDWEYLCEIQWKFSNSKLWREFCWKTLIRFFYHSSSKKTLFQFIYMLETIWMPRGKSFSHILVLFKIVAFLAGGLQHFGNVFQTDITFEFVSLFVLSFTFKKCLL